MIATNYDNVRFRPGAILNNGSITGTLYKTYPDGETTMQLATLRKNGRFYVHRRYTAKLASDVTFDQVAARRK